MHRSVIVCLLFLLNFSKISHAAILSEKNHLPAIRHEDIDEYRCIPKIFHSDLSRAEMSRSCKKIKKSYDKLERAFYKAERTIRGGSAGYLTLCLIFFLVSILFFALPGAIFNIFGSVTALAAAVFFVLWLLEYTGNI